MKDKKSLTDVAQFPEVNAAVQALVAGGVDDIKSLSSDGTVEHSAARGQKPPIETKPLAEDVTGKDVRSYDVPGEIRSYRGEIKDFITERKLSELDKLPQGDLEKIAAACKTSGACEVHDAPTAASHVKTNQPTTTTNLPGH